MDMDPTSCLPWFFLIFHLFHLIWAVSLHVIPSNLRAASTSSRSIRVNWSVSSIDPDHKKFDGFYVWFREMEDPPPIPQYYPPPEESLTSLTSSTPATHAAKPSPPPFLSKTVDISSTSAGTNSDFFTELTDLKKNQLYIILIQAFLKEPPSSGPKSEEVTVQTTEFDAPVMITMKATTLDHHSLLLSWEMEEDNPVSGFAISYKSHLENWEEKKVSGNRTSFLLDNLRCGTKYQITSTAYNRAGRSSPTDLVSAATAGNVPSTPSFESLVHSNETAATIDLSAWTDNGCPIIYFVVQYRQHLDPEWIPLYNNLSPDQGLVTISSLMPASWYDLSIVAHSEAGSNEAQYLFSTLTERGETLSPYGDTEEPVWTMGLNDPVLIAPILCTCFILVVIFASVGYFTASISPLPPDASGNESYFGESHHKLDGLEGLSSQPPPPPSTLPPSLPHLTGNPGARVPPAQVDRYSPPDVACTNVEGSTNPYSVSPSFDPNAGQLCT